MSPRRAPTTDPDDVSRRRDAVRAEAHARGLYPAPLNEGRSRNMRANRRTDTKPEIALRAALHRLGYRFRKDLRFQVGGVRVRPDIVFTRRRVAIFIDGCFWHACPEHGTLPKNNREWWREKLRRNTERDHEKDEALDAQGWLVVHIWEHVPTADAADAVESLWRTRTGRDAQMPPSGRAL